MVDVTFSALRSSVMIQFDPDRQYREIDKINYY